MRKIAKLLPLIIIAFATSFTVHAQKSKQVFNVVIDIAHGGKDAGIEVEGYSEKEISAKIADRLRELNDDSEIVLHFTREGDTFTGLDERVAKINNIKPDLVLSLHVNGAAGNTDRYGMEFFVPKEGKTKKKSLEYAEMLANVFHKQHYTVDGVKPAGFYILKNSESPAILCELGYLTNAADRVYLTSERSHNEIAGVLLSFIKDVKNG